MVLTISERIDMYNKALLPSKVAGKYKLLAQNPFSFFRGTNHLFYEDLSLGTLPASPVGWICGDLHIENFGSYKGDNRLVYFDLNDFDESIMAPLIWELARVITSILVAFNALEITDKEAIKGCEIFLKKYSRILANGSPKYIETRTATGIVKKFLRSVEGRSQKKLVTSRTVRKDGILQLSTIKNKQLMLDKELKQDLMKAFKKWTRSNNHPLEDYKVLDAKFRFAGTGSMGINRYVLLIEKIGDPNKQLLIDMKQASTSSLNPFVNVPQPNCESEAHRIAGIQKTMQNIPPALLSTFSFKGEFYIMQELQPTVDRINFELIEDHFKIVCSVIEDMAMLTASAHLRGVGRKGSCSADELVSFGQNTNWHTGLINYSVGYKKKVIQDYKEFKRLLKSKLNKAE
jgi:uncharacterized protein (DUF2252 family)